MHSLLFIQVHDLEFAQVEVQVVQGLKNGTAALKKIHQVCSIAIILCVQPCFVVGKCNNKQDEVLYRNRNR